MTNQISRTMNFWQVIALVIGSQVGSGVFVLPAGLAPYGLYGVVGWLISGVGAIMLALVFAQLCAWFPKTGGPHVYVHEAFGRSIAFFTGWTYWVISWATTTVVIVASVGYLIPLIGYTSAMLNVFLQILLLLVITILNFRGVTAAGRTEFLLTILKIIPLVIIPLFALFYFDIANFSNVKTLPLTVPNILSRVTLLTLWGFVGLESATTPAESVKNPSTTIPRAIVIGTFTVAVVYIINSLAIMGIIPGTQLANSIAPYADAAHIIFGGNWHLVISMIASIICIGTLNAWTLTSGQIALGLAQDRLLPLFFGYKNKYGAPYIALTLSFIGLVPLLLLSANKSLAAQLLNIIDFSVIAFLFVYAICCLSFLKIVIQKNEKFSKKITSIAFGSLALIFCCWVIYDTPLNAILIASLFTISGIPIYLFSRFKKQ